VLRLRVGLAPDGTLFSAELVGLPSAGACVTEAARSVRVPAWRGSLLSVLVALDQDGRPR